MKKGNNIKKILFITLTNIGDVILTLPILTALKDNYPGATIDVVTGPRPRDVFIKDPGVRKIFVYDKHSGLKEKLYFIVDLRKEGYDLAVDMRSSLIPVLIAAKKRTPIISNVKKPLKHKRLDHLDKIKSLSMTWEDKTNIHIDDEDRKKINALLEDNAVEKGDILIGVSPSCRSPLKEWNKAGFAEVIRRILEKERRKVILLGDESQVRTSEEIRKKVDNKNLIDLTGKINLKELFALTERLRLLLTCDSACLHIACDLGIKVVSIFGPTDPREYGPTGKDDIVIRKDLPCSPCKKAACEFSHECMGNIKPDEVVNAVLKALS